MIQPFKQTGLGSVAPYGGTMRTNKSIEKAIDLNPSALSYEKSPHFKTG